MKSLLCSDVDLRTGTTVTLVVLRVAVAGFFAWLASKSFLGDPAAVNDFRRFGYSDAFRYVVACMQVAGALALLFTPIVFWGAVLLAVVLAGAVYSHLRFDPLAALVAPLVFLALLAPIMYCYRPQLLR